MVNEFNVGSGTVAPGTKMARDEYIEFLIVEPTTAAQLASMTFGDSNASTSRLQSAFQFDQATLQTALAGSGLTAFQPGSIIVVKGAGLGAQDLDYHPMSGNTGDADAWSIQLVAGQGAKDSPNTKVDGNYDAASAGDVMWISSKSPTSNTDTSGIISAIGFDSSPGLVASNVISTEGSGSILRTTVANGSAISNVGGSTESLVVGATGSMGVANGGTNSTFITGLRDTAALSLTPEPSRTSLIGAGMMFLLSRRQRKEAAYA